MGEFKYIKGLAVEIQKLLNQWKHQYIIKPIETKIVPREDKSVMIYMLLWRESINPNQKEKKMSDKTNPVQLDDPWKHRSEGMRCKTCMWYVEKICDASIPIGRCRRRAPTMNGYPVVFEHDWCGDHKLNENTF